MLDQDNLPRVLSIAVASGLSLGILVFVGVDAKTGAWLVAEGGPVEIASVALWLLAAAVSFTAGFLASFARLEWFLGSIVSLLFAARELDVQKILSWNIGTPANYFNPEVPLSERLIVLALIVIPAGSVLAAFGFRMWKRFRAAWCNGSKWAQDVIILGVMFLIAVLMDKFHKLMPILGLDLSYRYIPHVFEEVLEMVLALYIVLLLYPLWRQTIRPARA